MASQATQLTQEERLIVSIANAACFSLRVGESNEALTDEVDSYVALLIKLHDQKPHATTGMSTTSTVRDAVAFCADQLTTRAPDLAEVLRAALDHRNAI